MWHVEASTGRAFDLVVIRSTWDYFDRLEEFLAWVDRVDSVTRIVNSPSVIRWNSHKGYLAELGAAGVPVLPSLDPAAGRCRRGRRMLRRGLGRGRHQAGRRRRRAAGAAGPRRRPRRPRAPGAARRVRRRHRAALRAGRGDRGRCRCSSSAASSPTRCARCPSRGDYRVQAMHGGREECTSPPRPSWTWPVPPWPWPRTTSSTRASTASTSTGEPTLMELELIEPDLFLRMAPGSARGSPSRAAQLPG